MMDIVALEDVWKRFPFRRDSPGFKEFIVNLHRFVRRDPEAYFWALKGVSLRVARGECFGIIGKNGAGKSTLLAVILGSLTPTRGTVKVSRKITPLLELGAGFHPDLTGRENILINGVLLGLTRDEVMARMADIVEFSEIGEFIDMPGRTYSSGMHLRLAFAIAMHVDPSLLLIDEILSVGDGAFQQKSKDALLRLIKGGVTTILVSHNMADVKEVCDRAIWLDAGEIKAEGDPGHVIEEYMNASARLI